MATKAIATCQPETADLFIKNARRDAEYHLQLVECDRGWSCLAQYGRRGSTLTAITRVENGTYADAKASFDKKLREELAKGYKLSESSSPALTVVSGPQSKVAVFSPELLTRIESERELLAYISNPRYYLELKRDGRRLAVHTRGSHKANKYETTAYNKSGQVIQVDADIRKAVESLCYLTNTDSIFLDGEIEPTGYHIWEILECDHDMRGVAYERRREMLEEVLRSVTKKLHLVQCAKTAADKDKLFAWAKANRAEGVCAKDKFAVYVEGRNGQHKKYKFETTASFIVGPKPPRKANDGHRSMALYLLDTGFLGGERWDPRPAKEIAKTGFLALRFMATCKVATKYKVPAIGEIVDVRYLYAFRNGGVYQPVFFGTVRGDIKHADCNVQQLQLREAQ